MYNIIKCPGCGEGVKVSEYQEMFYCDLCHCEFYPQIICPICKEIQPYFVKALPNGICQKCFQDDKK
jgi:hypothetical protein